MAKEIERKYLVKTGLWQPQSAGITIRQGYLSSAKERVVRVRTKNDRAFLTIKGITTGISRSEFEYEIPPADAQLLLDNLCEKPLIEKTRYQEIHNRQVWEIDVFFGENEGLIVAEVELADEAQVHVLPEWAGSEVSSDPRYFNSNLIAHPYKRWGAST